MSKSAGSTGIMKFQGGCHCGAVRFEIEIGALPTVYECYLHLIVPQSRFRLLSGQDMITNYCFNTGVARHMFCKICGIKSFYIPRSNPDGYSVNFRCLDNRPDISGIEPFDGRNWEQAHALRDLVEPD